MRRLNPLVLVLVLAAFGLAACGGTETSQPEVSPGEVVHQAAAKMAAAKSARFTTEGTMRNKQYAQRALPFSVKGQFVFGGEKAWLWWDLRDVYPTMIASHAPPGQKEIYRALFDDAHGWRMEIRAQGRDAWVFLPAFAEIFGAKPWIRARSSEVLARPWDQDADFPWLDLGDLIRYLDAANRVEEIGVEDGLTHYRARVPLRRLVARAPKKERARLTRFVRQVIAQTGKRALPLQVWLDSDGLPRRFSVTEWEPRSKDERYPSTWRSTIDILEYSVDFDVLRPPVRKVMTEQQFDRLTES